MDTINEEENWSCFVIEEDSPAPPPEDIARHPCVSWANSTTCSVYNEHRCNGPNFSMTHKKATRVIFSLRKKPIDPPSKANRALEDFPDSTMHSFSKEHLNFLLYIHRDTKNQLFHQENINRRLDIIFYSLSGEPSSSHCPICRHPFILTPAWNHPPTGDGGNSTSSV
jgi:hypothetical protein